MARHINYVECLPTDSFSFFSAHQFSYPLRPGNGLGFSGGEVSCVLGEGLACLALTGFRV